MEGSSCGTSTSNVLMELLAQTRLLAYVDTKIVTERPQALQHTIAADARSFETDMHGSVSPGSCQGEGLWLQFEGQLFKVYKVFKVFNFKMFS
jgi:hypothetical protein